MWTAAFPRIAGAETSRNGLPLSTLDIKHVVEGSAVLVTVALCYGGPGQNCVTVGTVRLADDQPVRVDGLRSYGVEPVTLSLVTLEPSTAYAPDVMSVSGQLTARAEALGANVSAYRVVVTNRSNSKRVEHEIRSSTISIGSFRRRRLPRCLNFARGSVAQFLNTSSGSRESSSLHREPDNRKTDIGDRNEAMTNLFTCAA